MDIPGTPQTYQSQDGLELFYRDYGDGIVGTPIVCLPGLTRNSRDFVDVAVHIGERRRVITPDLRGRGNSMWDPEWRNYHPGTYVNDVRTLLDTLGIERAIIVGTSLGGLCAMGMAAMDAGRLAAVVLNDVGPEASPAALERIRHYVGKDQPPRTWEEAVEQTRRNYGESLPGLGDEDWKKIVWRTYREGDDGAPVADYDPNIGRAVAELGAQTADPWPFFEALGPVPTKLLWGEMSDILTRDIIDKMVVRKPDLEVIPVRNRGHAPLLDEPECRAALDAVLEETP